MPVDIDYYDGNTSQARAARVWLDDQGAWLLELDGRRIGYGLDEVAVSDRLGNTVRSLCFPDGARGETLDNDGVDALLAAYRPARSGWLHRLESRYRSVLLALLLTAGLSWGFVAYGVPWLAAGVARAMPASLDRTIGEQTLALLDQGLLKPSELDPDVQADYRERFAVLAALHATGHDYRLAFRHSPAIGANALALPNGTVVLTDELVQLAESPDEVVAVLAHELGHVVGRHGMRQALQSSLVVLVVAAVTGDVGTAGGLASVLPVVLVEAGYSRDLEHEADLYAMDLMRRQGIPLPAFAAILRRLDAAVGGDGESGGFLDTHPAPVERAALFEASSPGDP